MLCRDPFCRLLLSFVSLLEQGVGRYLLFFSVSFEFCYWVAVELIFFAINEIHSWPCSVLQFLAAVASLAFRTTDPSSTSSVLCWASSHGTWRPRGSWNRARSSVTRQDPWFVSLGAGEEGWREKFKLSHGGRDSSCWPGGEGWLWRWLSWIPPWLSVPAAPGRSVERVFPRVAAVLPEVGVRREGWGAAVPVPGRGCAGAAL